MSLGKRNGQLKDLLSHIEELNERMQDIGLGAEVVDVEALRKQVIREPEPRPPVTMRGAMAPTPAPKKTDFFETKLNAEKSSEESDEEFEKRYGHLARGALAEDDFEDWQSGEEGSNEPEEATSF
jgi:hypothetical protein